MPVLATGARDDPGGDVGLCLLASDGDGEGPDASWSYTRFGDFRQRLAAAEGFVLGDMYGFGGERAWSSVLTSLEPLLDHPDEHGELSAADRAAVLPRLVEILDDRAAGVPDPASAQQLGTGRDLATVMLQCVEREVALVFA